MQIMAGHEPSDPPALFQRNQARNPLLSNAVTGLSIDDLMRSAVLIPARPSTQAQEQSAVIAAAAEHPEERAPMLTHSEPEPAAGDEDFDVNTYLERLRVSRYVSAPRSVEPAAETVPPDGDFSEVSLDSSDGGQGIASNLAQNISQLPQVLPQVASAVFSSFSSILRGSPTNQGAPAADEIAPRAEAANGSEAGGGAAPAGPVPMLDAFQFRNGQSADRAGGADASNQFRINTRQKKTYAQIPGIRLGEIETVNPPQPHGVNISANLPPMPRTNDLETVSFGDNNSHNRPSQNFSPFTPVLPSVDPMIGDHNTVAPPNFNPQPFKTTSDLVPKVPYAPKGYLHKKTSEAQNKVHFTDFYDPSKYKVPSSSNYPPDQEGIRQIPPTPPKPDQNVPQNPNIEEMSSAINSTITSFQTHPLDSQFVNTGKFNALQGQQHIEPQIPPLPSNDEIIVLPPTNASNKLHQKVAQDPKPEEKSPVADNATLQTQPFVMSDIGSHSLDSQNINTAKSSPGFTNFYDPSKFIISSSNNPLSQEGMPLTFPSAQRDFQSVYDANDRNINAAKSLDQRSVQDSNNTTPLPPSVKSVSLEPAPEKTESSSRPPESLTFYNPANFQPTENVETSRADSESSRMPPFAPSNQFRLSSKKVQYCPPSSDINVIPSNASAAMESVPFVSQFAPENTSLMSKISLPFSNVGKLTSAVTSFFDPSYYNVSKKEATFDTPEICTEFYAPNLSKPSLPSENLSNVPFYQGPVIQDGSRPSAVARFDYQPESKPIEVSELQFAPTVASIPNSFPRATFKTTGDLVPKVPYAPKGYLRKKAKTEHQTPPSFFDPTKFPNDPPRQSANVPLIPQNMDAPTAEMSDSSQRDIPTTLQYREAVDVSKLEVVENLPAGSLVKSDQVDDVTSLSNVFSASANFTNAVDQNYGLKVSSSDVPVSCFSTEKVLPNDKPEESSEYTGDERVPFGDYDGYIDVQFNSNENMETDLSREALTEPCGLMESLETTGATFDPIVTSDSGYDDTPQELLRPVSLAETQVRFEPSKMDENLDLGSPLENIRNVQQFLRSNRVQEMHVELLDDDTAEVESFVPKLDIEKPKLKIDASIYEPAPPSAPPCDESFFGDDPNGDLQKATAEVFEHWRCRRIDDAPRSPPVRFDQLTAGDSMEFAKPPIPLASYFDSGDYAAERRSLDALTLQTADSNRTDEEKAVRKETDDGVQLFNPSIFGMGQTGDAFFRQ